MTIEELINQRATTCRHGGHCEWVACDKCNHYEPDALSQQPCEDCNYEPKDYDALNDLVLKTQELHRAIFDKGYEQGQKDALVQQPCEDCVSRQAVLELIEDCNSDGLKGIFCSYNDGKRFEAYIKDLPSVAPKEKTGKWIDSKDWKERHYDSINFRKRCSLCNGTGNIQDKFCPNCGADMRGDNNAGID